MLDPDREPGRLTFIHRFGHKKIADGLPPLIEAVRRAGRTVLWVCDPMHGNTETVANGLKTRRFDHILSELEQAFDLHEELGSYLGGVHFELTGEDVTECMGGARGLTEEDLQRAYRSQVDPRLNYEQALEMALLIAQRMGRANHLIRGASAGKGTGPQAPPRVRVALVTCRPGTAARRSRCCPGRSSGSPECTAGCRPFWRPPPSEWRR